jgi:hypothetical protein
VKLIERDKKSYIFMNKDICSIDMVLKSHYDWEEYIGSVIEYMLSIHEALSSIPIIVSKGMIKYGTGGSRL